MPKKSTNFRLWTRRYDSTCENEGKDYPLEYVRWRLNRNMKSYIDTIDSKKINTNNLIDKIYSKC